MKKIFGFILRNCNTVTLKPNSTLEKAIKGTEEAQHKSVKDSPMGHHLAQVEQDRIRRVEEAAAQGRDLYQESEDAANEIRWKNYWEQFPGTMAERALENRYNNEANNGRHCSQADYFCGNYGDYYSQN